MDNDFDLSLYYSTKEMMEITGLNQVHFDYNLAEKIKGVKYNDKWYWHKEGVEFLKKLKQEYYTTNEASDILKTVPNTMKNYLVHDNWMRVGKKLYIPKLIINDIAKKKDECYTIEETAKLLECTARNIRFKFGEEDRINFFGRVYIKKESVHTVKNNSMNNYYTMKEVIEIFGITERTFLNHYREKLKTEKILGKICCPKDIVDEEYEKSSRHKYYDIIQMQDKYGIEYMRLSEREKYSAIQYGKNAIRWLYPKEVIDANISSIKDSLPPINKDDYYTLTEISEKIERSISTITPKMQTVFEGIDVGKTRLFPKSVVDAHLELFEDTIMVQDVAKETHVKYEIGIKRLRTLLKKNNKLIKNPVSNYSFVKKNDLEQIFELCENDNKQLTPYEAYEKYKEECIPQANITNTIKALDTYAMKRLNKRRKSPADARIALCQIYKFLATRLLKELIEVDKEQVNLYIQAMGNDASINKYTLNEFVGFLNYLHKKKIYTINYENALNNNSEDEKKEAPKKDNSKKDVPYTQVEYLHLWNFVYNKIFENEYLERIINNRNSAASCLYIAMHYVALWRRSDVIDMPYPYLEILGFSTGEDFISWLQQGNKFTENMGIVMCRDMQLKIQALGVEASKNDRPLVFEFGMLQARTLGFLLGLCEAHRRIASKQNEERIGRTNHKYVIPKIAKKIFVQDKVLNEELNKILNGQKFLNKRANKSYANYVLAKSEEGKYGIGYFIVSVLRSHTLNEDFVAAITQKYLNPNVNGTIDDICLTLFDRGTFGFAKHQLLSMIDPKFELLDFKEQTSLMAELGTKNSDIEKACKSIQTRKEFVNTFITKAVTNTKDAIKVLNQIAYGTNSGESKHTKCLLRAMLSADILGENESDTLEGKFACVRGNCISCIGCPMLIQETLFMAELNMRVIDTLERALRAKSERDKEMYSQLIYDGYIPLLDEFAKEMGYSRLEEFVNLDKIELLHKEIKGIDNGNIKSSGKK